MKNRVRERAKKFAESIVSVEFNKAKDYPGVIMRRDKSIHVKTETKDKLGRSRRSEYVIVRDRWDSKGIEVYKYHDVMGGTIICQYVEMEKYFDTDYRDAILEAMWPETEWLK